GKFDLIDFRSGEQASPTGAPWDSSAAKALARLHACSDANPEPENAAAIASSAQPSRPDQIERCMAAEIVDKTAGKSSSEREWFEQRLSDLAMRLESSLAALRSDRSVAALGDRLDQIEQRFNSALEGMVTRADVEGLRIVEAHLSELIAHVDSAHD